MRLLVLAISTISTLAFLAPKDQNISDVQIIEQYAPDCDINIESGKIIYYYLGPDGMLGRSTESCVDAYTQWQYEPPPRIIRYNA